VQFSKNNNNITILFSSVWYNWKTLVILVIKPFPIRITSYHVSSSSVISHTFNGNGYVHTQFASSKSTLSISSAIVRYKERYRSCVGLFLGSTLSIPSAIDWVLIGTILVIQHFFVWIGSTIHIEDGH
jgi:hypothetical protein